MINCKHKEKIMGLMERLVKLIDKRDQMIKLHYGENLRLMLNFPTERKWYEDNICIFDKKIIILARTILPDETFNKISDVYQNAFLMNKCLEFKYKNYEPQK